MNCKHKYQPRYDEEWTTDATESVKMRADTKVKGKAQPYLKTKTYIHDICVKCGDIKGAENEKL